MQTDCTTLNYYNMPCIETARLGLLTSSLLCGRGGKTLRSSYWSPHSEQTLRYWLQLNTYGTETFSVAQLLLIASTGGRNVKQCNCYILPPAISDSPLLKRMVSALLVGLVNLAKTIPAMQAWMTTPTMLWADIATTASPQCSVGTRDPYLHSNMNLAAKICQH